MIRFGLRWFAYKSVISNLENRFTGQTTQAKSKQFLILFYFKPKLPTLNVSRSSPVSGGDVDGRVPEPGVVQTGAPGAGVC